MNESETVRFIKLTTNCTLSSHKKFTTNTAVIFTYLSDLFCLPYAFDQLADQKGCQRDRTPNLSY
jgi:hypothetical protein